jgi:cell division protein FtsL
MSVESGRSERAALFGGWVQVAALVVTLIIAIGGAIVFSESRAARSDSAATVAEKQAADHETRLRRLEESWLRMEGKIDRIADRVGARR